jgi:hypothetical protein
VTTPQGGEPVTEVETRRNLRALEARRQDSEEARATVAAQNSYR